jgi:hypothetical protein
MRQKTINVTIEERKKITKEATLPTLKEEQSI